MASAGDPNRHSFIVSLSSSSLVHPIIVCPAFGADRKVAIVGDSGGGAAAAAGVHEGAGLLP